MKPSPSPPDHAKPETVQVVVVAEGHENARGEQNGPTIKNLVTEKTKDHNRGIVVLGTNQDAVIKGEALGIERD
jgi:hypothetical protein